MCIVTEMLGMNIVVDPGGPGVRPPTPVKTSQKKDGHRAMLQVSQVIGNPRTNFWIRYWNKLLN